MATRTASETSPATTTLWTSLSLPETSARKKLPIGMLRHEPLEIGPLSRHDVRRVEANATQEPVEARAVVAIHDVCDGHCGADVRIIQQIEIVHHLGVTSEPGITLVVATAGQLDWPAASEIVAVAGARPVAEGSAYRVIAAIDEIEERPIVGFQLVELIVAQHADATAEHSADAVVRRVRIADFRP